MEYAGIIKNDSILYPKFGFTLLMPDKTLFDTEPKEFTIETLNEIINNLTHSKMKKDLYIRGGEPFDTNNSFLTLSLVVAVKHELPDTNILLWSKYTLESLKEKNNNRINQILRNIDYLINDSYEFTIVTTEKE